MDAPILPEAKLESAVDVDVRFPMFTCDRTLEEDMPSARTSNSTAPNAAEGPLVLKTPNGEKS